MNASADLVAKLALEARRLRDELERVKVERDGLERALFLCHQYQQECYDRWTDQANQNKLLRGRLEVAETYERAGEAAREMGHTFPLQGGDPA